MVIYTLVKEVLPFWVRPISDQSSEGSMKILKTVLGAAVLIAASISASSAATVSYEIVTDWSAYDLTNTAGLGGGEWVTGDAGFLVTPGGSVEDLHRSPFDDSGTAVALTNWADLPYWAIGPGNPEGNDDDAATLEFDGTWTGFSFIWGSVDSYNSIQFFNGATSTLLLTSALLSPTGFPTAVGAIFTTVTDLVFDRIVFKSTDQEALEVALFAAVPVPPAIALLGSGLVGLGFLGWRRKRAAAAA